MSSFQARGEAQLLAIEGERKIAAALARLIRNAFGRMAATLTRRS